jgi:hypothetical protein
MNYAISSRTTMQTPHSLVTHESFMLAFAEWFHEARQFAKFMADTNTNPETVAFSVLYKKDGVWKVLESFEVKQPVADVDGVIPAGPDPMEPDYDGVPADTM